mmetsp:Transcript_14246/g.29751  ORF Transcript_14246/g.29751 Transcript_14246/m.29751 type:complete len:139 (+) Transcript_14246:372-788(+)
MPGAVILPFLRRCFRPMSCNKLYMRASATMSRAEVASSRITSWGWLTRTLPNANRCCSPSDRVFVQSKTVDRPLMGSPSPDRDASSPRSTFSRTSSRSSSLMNCFRTCDRLATASWSLLSPSFSPVSSAPVPCSSRLG